MPPSVCFWRCLVVGLRALRRRRKCFERANYCKLECTSSEIRLPPGNDVNQCWGFMTAVLEYETLTDTDGKTLLNACPDPDTTIPQVIGIFVKYARSHPEKLNLRAAAVAYNAMADAFPSK